MHNTCSDTVLRWFVTPPLAPDIRIAGPFATRDEAELACLQRTNKHEKEAAFLVGKLPTRYVARPFTIRIAVLHLYSPPRAAPEPTAKRAAQQQHKLRLPKLVHTYDRTSLLALCRVLDVGLPNANANRAEIIAHLERELAELEKG